MTVMDVVSLLPPAIALFLAFGTTHRDAHGWSIAEQRPASSAKVKLSPEEFRRRGHLNVWTICVGLLLLTLMFSLTWGPGAVALALIGVTMVADARIVWFEYWRRTWPALVNEQETAVIERENARLDAELDRLTRG